MHFIQIIDSPQPAYNVDNMITTLQTRGLRLREVRWHVRELVMASQKVNSDFPYSHSLP